MNQKSGLLIAIEGIDGAGKSTLAKNIYINLLQQNYKVLLTKEPGGTELGQQLRSILQNRTSPIASKAEFLLFAADRAQHFEQLIVPALAQNNIVISDRLSDSSLVYQGYGRGLDKQMITTINNWAMNNKKPDLTIYVRLNQETATARLAQRAALTSFEQEQQEFLQKIVHGFETLYKNRADVLTIDGNKAPEILTEQAVVAIKKLL